MTDLLRAQPRRHARLAAVGGYRPARVVGNAELCANIDSSEEWIESHSGIRTRRYAGPAETLPAMGAAAGAKALAAAGLTPADVDCVIAASMSDLVQTPPLAFAIAHELGAPRAAGFDVSAACAGFCHALSLAGDMVSLGQAERVLVVGAERMTDIVDPADRSIAFLFADGAGAAVVEPSRTPGIGPTVRAADTGSLGALRMSTSWRALRAEPGLPAPVMRMDGRRVFRWAVENVVPACLRALEASGIAPGDLAAFVPHQANLRMIEVLVHKLGLPGHVVVAEDVRESGNTSSASVPLALERLLELGLVEPGRPALLAGFGAGLNLAAQVVLVPERSGNGGRPGATR